MRVSEALDLGSIPNATTKNALSISERAFFMWVQLGMQALSSRLLNENFSE
jgi:hypothetical protein